MGGLVALREKLEIASSLAAGGWAHILLVLPHWVLGSRLLHSCRLHLGGNGGIAVIVSSIIGISFCVVLGSIVDVVSVVVCNALFAVSNVLF
jgi:hypothetical protein